MLKIGRILSVMTVLTAGASCVYASDVGEGRVLGSWEERGQFTAIPRDVLERMCEREYHKERLFNALANVNSQQKANERFSFFLREEKRENTEYACLALEVRALMDKEGIALDEEAYEGDWITQIFFSKEHANLFVQSALRNPIAFSDACRHANERFSDAFVAQQVVRFGGEAYKAIICLNQQLNGVEVESIQDVIDEFNGGVLVEGLEVTLLSNKLDKTKLEAENALTPIASRIQDAEHQGDFEGAEAWKSSFSKESESYKAKINLLEKEIAEATARHEWKLVYEGAEEEALEEEDFS